MAKTIRTVLLSVIGLIIGIGLTYLFLLDFKDTIRSQANGLFGREILLEIHEVDQTTDFEIKKESLMKEFEYYEKLFALTQDDVIVEPADFIVASLSLSHQYRQRQAMENESFFNHRREIEQFGLPPEVIRNIKRMDSLNCVNRKNALIAELPKHKNVNCLVAETFTIIAKHERGEFNKIINRTYSVKLEIPVNKNISFFAETFVTYTESTKSSNVGEKLMEVKVDFEKFKAKNNCP